MPRGSKKRFYVAGNAGETPMGRSATERVMRKSGEHLLGSGMAKKAAEAIRRRKRMLEQY